MDYQRLLERAMAAAAATAGRGQVADDIPALATVDPDAFGMAIATLGGEIYGVGQVERPFSMQSVSKLFALALLLAEIGDRVWQGVGREPSGNPFNSLVQLESERGIPRNPFINAGAPVVPTGCCRPQATPLGRCASSCGLSPGTRSWTPTGWSPGPSRAGPP
ncbi:MAG TPA: glutaminase [Mycobacterium sp.]|nr:glutaminase [Mycobacterium sp.]